MFSDEREIERLKGDKAIGHVRYATAGSGGTDNIQPFIFRFHDGDMALCHNGNLTNCPSLRRKLEDEGAIFHSNSDTEVLMHLIRRSSKPTFMDKLKEALNTVHGGFAYLIMTEHAMIGALDPNGFRPLSLGRMTNGAYVLASETCALDTVGADWCVTSARARSWSWMTMATASTVTRIRPSWPSARWNSSTSHAPIPTSTA